MIHKLYVRKGYQNSEYIKNYINLEPIFLYQEKNNST